jgi:hypothetical protein
VTLTTGLGSGLAAALVRIGHDRRAQSRELMLAAISDFAGNATNWVDALTIAITQREHHLLQADYSQPAFHAADVALQDARSKVNRLQVLVLWQSEIGVHASGFVSALEAGVEELRDWPPQPNDQGDDEQDSYEDDSDLREDERYDPLLTPIDDAIAEAVFWRGAALSVYREFTRAAAEETHRPFRVIAWRRLRRGNPS